MIDHSTFLRNSSVSGIQFPVLNTFGIRWIGTTYVDFPSTRVADSDDKKDCHLHINLGASGEVLVDGKWTRWPGNSAYVNPTDSDWGWRLSDSTEQMEHFYIRYLTKNESCFPVSKRGSYIVEFDDFHDDFHEIISMYEYLYKETNNLERPLVIRCFVELVAFHGREIILGTKSQSQLSRLWAQVLAEPEKPWTIHALSEAIDVSPETLRLHCKREVSRSPMRQVTFLRMRKAAGMLETTDLTLQQIAQCVGYESSFNFSTAFKRVFGVSPAEYRKKSRKITRS